MLKLNLSGQAYLRRQVERYGIDCQLQACGKYQAAVEERGLAVLDAYRRGLDKLDQPYQMIERETLPEHLGTDFYQRALYTPGAVLIQPSALVKGLAENLPTNVTLFERTPILDVDYGPRPELRHAAGRITAGKTGAGQQFLRPALRLPAGAHAADLHLRSLTRRLTPDEQALLGGKPFWGAIPADPFGTTVRRTPDQRLLIRNSFSFNPDGRSNPKHLQRVLQRHQASFARRFPMLPKVTFEYTWGGALAMTRNHNGFFGQLAPNVYGALGCNGLGVTRGTATGKLLANWLAGERDELIDFLLAAPGPNANPPQPFLSAGVNFNLLWGQYRAGCES